MSKLSVFLVLLSVPQCLRPQAASDVFTKSTVAIGYQVGAGKTKVDFKGTALMPGATGLALVQAKPGYTGIDATFAQIGPLTPYGSEFLTFVLWAISPDGRAANLGELLIDKNGNGKMSVSTQMSTFSLLVTAEPYFAVKMPSEVVVLENAIRKDTRGKQFVVNSYPLLKKARYQKLANPLALGVDLKTTPLDLYEARNAVAIAKSNGAEQFAPDVFVKAASSLQMAENAQQSKANRKQVVSTARQAVQFSQDALTLAIERETQARLDSEQKARAAAEQLAREQAARQTALRAQADAQRAQAEAASAAAQVQAAQAEAAKQKAEADRLRALAAQREADIQRQQALEAQRQADLQRQQALAATQQAEQQRAQAVAEKAQLRARLLAQFQAVLETRDTPRGLVINMSDVLFDSGKFTLRTMAREKLARIAGIILNYPDLKIQAEGYTDNVGSADFNQKLSEQRAGAVKDFLLSQGLPAANLSAVGLGFENPVASNDTAAGRQQNRRVELVVSGEIIGTAVGELKQ